MQKQKFITKLKWTDKPNKDDTTEIIKPSLTRARSSLHV